MFASKCKHYKTRFSKKKTHPTDNKYGQPITFTIHRYKKFVERSVLATSLVSDPAL